MADFGNLVLILALVFAGFGTFAAFFAGVGAKERLRRTAERAFIATALMVFLALFALGSLLQNDAFEIVYVFQHSNIALDTVFKLTAIWGGSQGSLLWWTMILIVYTLIFLALSRKIPKLAQSWAMFFVGVNIIFFLLINNVVANPFNEWAQITPGGGGVTFEPQDGRGLNPQLQHWAMIIHPPLLYCGYIGFLFPFAIMMGALITRLDGRVWLPIVRRWTLVAWLILGVGIILGGGWAYMELGWGGYWAWDPVENASFMPWLLATAFLHSVMAQETRGMFKVWNVLLLASSYLMCLVGTGITRSGFISSVHAFAASTIGWYFLVLIVVLSVLVLCVMAMRRDQFVDDNAIVSPGSREAGLLYNNVLFVAITVLILVATVWPVIHDALYDYQRELRHGFYNDVAVPIMVGLVFLMGIGPIMTWKKTTQRQAMSRFLPAGIVGVISGLIAIALGAGVSIPSLTVAVLAFVTVTIIQEFWIVVTRRMKRSGENPFTALYNVVLLNKRRYGGYITHFSVVIMCVGFIGAAFNHTAKQEVGVGGNMQVGDYTFQVANITDTANDNYVALIGTVNLMRDGKVVKTFNPEQRRYLASDMQASEVSIWSTLTRDYYVVLAGSGVGSTREHPIGVFHVYINPLVLFVWIGGVLMIVGTGVSLLPDRKPMRIKAAEKAGKEVTA